MNLSDQRKNISIDAYQELESKNPYQSILWAGIMGSSENVFFERLLARLLEKGSGYQLTKRSMALRDLAMGLAELDLDFRYFQKLFQHFEDPSLEAYFSYLKHLVGDVFENWSGASIFPRLICLGGVRKDLKMGDLKTMNKALDLLESEFLSQSDYVLGDRIVRENLIDLGYRFDGRQRNLILAWPGLKTQIASPNIEKLYAHWDSKKIPSLSTLIGSDVGEDLFYRFFLKRFLNSKSLISKVKKCLNDLPEGDCRIWMDHLHIPGGLFMAENINTPSGKLYAYYCSGKIRFESLSTHCLKLVDEGQMGEKEPLNALFKALGVDLIQGELCAKNH